MDDKSIVELYWSRNEDAISHTRQKYGAYCHSIACNILYSREDAEECVNDTYLRAWEAIPPQRPSRLGAFLGKITRNLALNRYAYDRAQKRFTNVELALHELSECIADPASESPMEDSLALKQAINGFLAKLPQKTRILFVRRYWYLDSIEQLAKASGMTESNVKVTLHRARIKFRDHLQKEGIQL